jgi:hypothetical protein
VSIRAVILGLLLGLFVSGATYINDAVIRQTFLIGNHFPVSIFGAALLLLIAINPFLGALRDKLRLGFVKGPLRPVEIGLIAAIGLAACGWPGSNFYRGFTPIVTMPQHWLKTEASWKAANVMSYVPGASAELAEGHVQDWEALIEGLRDGAEPDAAGVPATVWSRLPQRAQRTIRNTDAAFPPAADRTAILAGLNDYVIAPASEGGASTGPGGQVPLFVSPGASVGDSGVIEARSAVLAEAEALRERDPDSPHLSPLMSRARGLTERANRLALVEQWPGVLLPPPEGEGLLVLGGRADEFVIDTMLTGRSKGDWLSLGQLPWGSWWPTIRLWGGAALLLGLGSLCLALIVHPQWSKRELLTYPIVKFLDEASERQRGDWLPTVARNRLFWIGLTVPIVIHTINGLNAWFPEVPTIPLELDLSGLRTLFPNARQVWMSSAYFTPTLYLSVIAFAFFLTTSVSFSLGVSQMLWVMLGAFLIANGETLDSDFIGAKKGNMMRFGGYLGMAAIILYTGRRYYLNVAGSMVGLARAPETPGYAVWAARGLVLCCVLGAVSLTSGGLPWWASVTFVAMSVLMFLVMSRIIAETGLIFMQAWWMPVGILTALLGLEAVGPTTYIVLALASVILVGDPREALMPYLTNGLKMADRPADGATPGRATPWLAIMVVVGFLVAGGVTLYLQYNQGINAKDGWARQSLPSMPFDQLSTNVKQMASEGTLAEATAATGWERLRLIQPEPGAVPWMVVGIALVVVVAAARLRLPWWPLHPVAFLVWGSYPITNFAFAFLVGWAVKVAVLRTGGAKSYHQIKPLMIGVIGGELTIALVWMIVGAIYYAATGLEPTSYLVFPA